MWAVAGRSFAYLVLVAACAELVRLEVLLVTPEDRFSERGYVELAQSLLLLLSILLLAVKAATDPQRRALGTCLTLAFAILLIRENDQFLEMWLVHGAWKYLAGLFLVALLLYFFRHREAVIAQFLDFSRSSAFGLLLGGFLTLAFARFLGSSRIWVPLMGDAYLPKVKDAVQEGGELGGLALLFLAVIEFALVGPAKRRA